MSDQQPLSKSTQKSQRHRLKGPAKEYLDSIYSKRRAEPFSAEVRRTILKEVHDIEGHDLYTETQLKCWINNKKVQDKKKTASAAPPAPVYESRAHQMLYPSLSMQRLKDLEGLYDEWVLKYGVNPSAEILTLWSGVLASDLQHVKNWVQERILLPKQASPSPFTANGTRSQLPTPLHSKSPEPGPSRVKNEPPPSPSVERATLHTDTNLIREEYEEKVNQLIGTHLPSPVSPSFPADQIPYIHQALPPPTPHPLPKPRTVLSVSVIKTRLAAAFKNSTSQPRKSPDEWQDVIDKFGNFTTEVAAGNYQKMGMKFEYAKKVRPPRMSVPDPTQRHYSNLASTSSSH